MINLVEISNNFLDRIQTVVLMAEKRIIRIPKIEDEATMFDLCMMTIQYKKYKYDVDNNNESNESIKEYIADIEEHAEKNPLLMHLIDNIHFEEKDDGFALNSTSPLFNSVSDRFYKNFANQVAEDELYRNSLVMTLATAFELLISDILKDFALSNINPNFLNDDKIDFKTLMELGDVSMARELLIDRYIEGVLRGGVTDWLKELSKISQNITFPSGNDKIDLLIETFQRRHLLVHNNGIVNNLYLNKVDNKVLGDVSKGQQLETTYEYIISRSKVFREVGLVLLYKYFVTCYKNKSDQIYDALEDILLHRINHGCFGAEFIYKSISEDKKFSSDNRLVAKINYWLLKKLSNNFDEVKKEVEKFEVSTLLPQFQMAKYLLMDDLDQAFQKFNQFIIGEDENSIFKIFQWPLMLIFNEYEPYIDYRKEKIAGLLGIKVDANKKEGVLE